VVTRKENAEAPWGRLIPRCCRPRSSTCASARRSGRFWTWLPTYFARSYHLVLKDSAIFTFGVLFAGVFGDIGGGLASATRFCGVPADCASPAAA